jgi:uridine kinase
MKKPIVIAISSISGGGKSVVVKKLAEMLENSIAIHFDDYETPDTYPKNPLDLMKNGFNFNVIKSPLLAQHLQMLKNGETVTTPQGEVLAPARFIVYEGPLGYAQHETGQFIDYMVFIDTPLEVGLARRFSRSIATSHYEDLNHEQLLRLVKHLKSFSDDYLLWIRKVYQIQLDIIRPASDLILEWDQTQEALTKDIIQALKKKDWL